MLIILVTCLVTAKFQFSFSFDLLCSVRRTVRTAQSMYTYITLCDRISHSANNLVGVTFVESVHDLCIIGTYNSSETTAFTPLRETQRQRQRREKKRHFRFRYRMRWYFSRHRVSFSFSLQIDLVMSSCSVISIWLAVKIIVSLTIFPMK